MKAIFGKYIWITYSETWKGVEKLTFAGAELRSSRSPGHYQAEQGLDDNCMQISTIIMMIMIVATKLMIIFSF